MPVARRTAEGVYTTADGWRIAQRYPGSRKSPWDVYAPGPQYMGSYANKRVALQMLPRLRKAAQQQNKIPGRTAQNTEGAGRYPKEPKGS